VRLAVLFGLGGAIAAGAVQDSRSVSLIQAPTGRRVALVLGNDAYPAMPLKNAVNDAKSIALALKQYQFDVDLGTDLPLKGLGQRIDRFVSSIRAGDIAMVYYAGHGMQIQGENYLIPTDFATQEEAEAKYQSYSASRIADRLADSGARLVILVLDACRTNPFRATRSGTRGLAAMDTSKGVLIAFATGPNQTADDSPGGANGLFTTYVLEAMKQPGLTIEHVFSWTRKKVYEQSGGHQTPWLVSSVIGDFYLNPQQAPAAKSVDDEGAYWNQINEKASAAAFREYLARYPNGRYVRLANLYLKALTLDDSAIAPGPSASPAANPAPPVVPVGASASIQQYFLKAQNKLTYAPFITPVGGRFQAASRIATYYRVERVGELSTPPAGARDRRYPYEDYQETDFSRLSPSERAVQASFSVPAGNYVLSIVSAPTDGNSKTATIQQLIAKVDRGDPDVSRTPVTVPDFWNGELNTSSVMVVSAIDTLPKPLTAAELATRPFALGLRELHLTNGRRFATRDELSVFFLIYNAANSPGTGRPDLTVDYSFYARPTGQPERYFNRTAPQVFNATTLPQGFDPDQHPLQAGQAVALKPFAPGEYRLEVTVQDRVSGRRLAREVTFTVY
jgi:hypothetical protein